MAMSAEDALKSTNEKVVKGAHSTVKDKISSAISSIEALEKNSAVDFDHSKISIIRIT
jgi:hypothetical protein